MIKPKSITDAQWWMCRHLDMYGEDCVEDFALTDLKDRLSSLSKMRSLGSKSGDYFGFADGSGLRIIKGAIIVEEI